jgi:Family of unknown function (DUF6756)
VRGAWSWVREIVQADERIAILDDALAEDLIERVKRKFVEDPSKLWWWESLRGESHSVRYADEQWLELMHARIGGQPIVNLIVTDDQPEPSGVVKGPPEAILNLLNETPKFEYAMTDPDVGWLILDNHHDVLVTVGELPSLT